MSQGLGKGKPRAFLGGNMCLASEIDPALVFLPYVEFLISGVRVFGGRTFGR
jgi:hypothetical protein